MFLLLTSFVKVDANEQQPEHQLIIASVLIRRVKTTVRFAYRNIKALNALAFEDAL
jgi:hypothetical protein